MTPRRWSLPRLSTPVLAVVGAVALLAAVGLLGAYLVVRDRDAHSGYVSRDLDGNRVRWDRTPDVAGSQVRRTGERFIAPRQHLSVPLLSAVVTGDEINPPSLTAAYWYRDLGDLDRAGTAVIAMHAVRGGHGPGNAFVRLPAGGSGPGRLLIHRGDPMLAGTSSYHVTRTVVEPKRDAAADARIWGADAADDRLVVITCLLDPDVPLEDQQNLVIFGRRTAS